jgi:hypothetical protein
VDDSGNQVRIVQTHPGSEEKSLNFDSKQSELARPVAPLPNKIYRLKEKVSFFFDTPSFEQIGVNR